MDPAGVPGARTAMSVLYPVRDRATLGAAAAEPSKFSRWWWCVTMTAGAPRPDR